MKEDYLQQIVAMDTLCQSFRDSVIDVFFRYPIGEALKATVDLEDKFFCFTPRYQSYFQIIKRIIEISDIFGIQMLERCKPRLMEHSYHLENPESAKSRENFEFHINEILLCFRDAKDEIQKKISLLNSSEIDRLNEAIHCFLEGCYYSSVAMSVHAIESRLFSLMMSIYPDPKLEELTLGQLIREYLDHKQEYGSVIPKKHEPLLEHCNTYRIFSVHPKKEEINKPIASSILNMTFLFLLDEKLVKKVEEAEGS